MVTKAKTKNTRRESNEVSLVMTKCVFGSFDQARHKAACAATEAS